MKANLKKQTSGFEFFSLPTLPSHQALPLFLQPVSAGFPSPAEDYLENHLDLNRYLIDQPAATFFVRVTGDSMQDAGIFSGDLLIVDRSKNPVNQSIVLAIVNGEFTVKRLLINGDHISLKPENPRYSILQVTPEMELEIWGVVKHVIHSFK